MLIEEFWMTLKELFGTAKLWPPSIIVISIVVVLYKERLELKKILEPYPKYYKKILVVSFIGAALLLYNRFVWNSFWLYLVGAGIALIPLVKTLIQYVLMQHRLKSVIKLSDTRLLDYREENALIKIKSLSSRKMTTKQKIRYERFKMYVLIQIGNIRAAKKIMEQMGPDILGPAHYHHLKYVSAYHSGDIGQAHEEIKKAADAKNKDTEPIIQVEILVNQGVSYASQKNYHAADDSFHHATQEYKKLGLNNKSLLFIIYKNYAFNKTRLDKNNQSYESIVSEYKALLDLNCYSDQLDFFNLELELQRQANVSREESNKFVKDIFTTFMESNLPLENKVMFAGSIIRIVWSAALDPEQCLTVLDNNYRVLDTLQPIARYRINKELSLLFKDLHGDLPEMYSTLRDTVRTYMVCQAEKDLNVHRKALPYEAIFARCYCLEELAGIERSKQDYNSKTVISFISDAIKLFQDNSLLVDELMSRLNIMDELCAIENVDLNLEPINPVEMRRQFAKIESILPSLMQHPVRGELGIRLSFYCLQLHEYNKCIEYYDLFTDSKLTLNHFAPWLQRYRMATAFTVRILHFKKIIVALQDSKEILLCSSELQEWFVSFPHHDGLLDSMLLARFIGCHEEYPLKIMQFPRASTTEEPRIHAWFYLPWLELNADLTYEQFSEDNNNRLFFNNDRHPFETYESQTIAKDVSKTGDSPKEVNFIMVKASTLPPVDNEVFNTIYDLVDKHVPANCPSQNELKDLFETTMMPMAAIE